MLNFGCISSIVVNGEVLPPVEHELDILLSDQLSRLYPPFLFLCLEGCCVLAGIFEERLVKFDN